jgi:hypothetical protein
VSVERSGRGSGSPGRLALVAAAGALVAVASFVVLVRTRPGQWIDNWGFEGRKALTFEGRRAVRFGLRILTPVAVVVMVAGAAALALARRQWSLAVASAVAVAGAWVSADQLKATLGRPRLLDTIATATHSFPSGHAATFTTAALVVLVVTRPARRRLVAAVLCVVVAFYVVALSTTGWHRPSDVIGALGLAAVWSCGAALVVRADRIGDVGTPAAGLLVPPAWVLVVLVDVVVLAVVVVFRTTVTGATRPLLSAAIAAVSLATAGALVVQAVAWALGRTSPDPGPTADRT